MNVVLVVVDGAKPATIELRLPTVVGRSNEATVKVRNALVSRKHCELYAYEGEIVVRDLQSSNGTFVNGQKIDAPTFLAPGDELRIGPVTLRAEYEPETADTQPFDMAIPTNVEPQHDESASAVSSVVSYSETDGGSFLGIEELASTAGPLDSPSSAVADLQGGDVTASDAIAGQVDESNEVFDFGGVGDAVKDSVESGDSKLDDFFKSTQ